jgi:hypothetical protein
MGFKSFCPPSNLTYICYDLAEMSADGLVLEEMCSSKQSPKRRFGQETRSKCRALGKILIHVQTLDLGKGPVEIVFVVSKPKF